MKVPGPFYQVHGDKPLEKTLGAILMGSSSAFDIQCDVGVR